MNDDAIRQVRHLTGRGPRPIADLPLPVGCNVLLLGPHPDDFDAVAVTLRHLQQRGHAIHAVVARSATGIHETFGDRLTDSDKARIREQEQRRSCARFGLSTRHLTFLDLDEDRDGPTASPGNLDRLRKAVLQGPTDLVVLPHGHDTNGAHRSFHGMMTQIASTADRSMVLLLAKDIKNIELRIDLYTAFGPEEAQWKGELLRMHASQHHRNLVTRGHGFDDRILRHNADTAEALALTAPHAEAFEIACPAAGLDGPEP